MSVSQNASNTISLSATLASYLERIVNGSSESSFTVQQIKKVTIQSSLLLLFMISGMAHLSAQKVGDKASIKTKAGNVIYGTLITLGDSTLSIETAELGLVTLAKDKVAKMRPALFKLDGSYWFENPNATRNLLSPTGFGLREGEGIYQNTMLFLQTFNYGITDNFSIGFGFEVASLFLGGGESPILVFTPKVSTASDSGINTSVGFTHIQSTNSLNFSVSILYNATTFGDHDNNFTAGIGFINNDQGKWIKSPVIAISAMGRVRKNFGLVTENWIITGNENGGLNLFLSGGGRYITPSITVDLALAILASQNRSVLPWLGVTIPFGK